jgi:hypothetical protein
MSPRASLALAFARTALALAALAALAGCRSNPEVDPRYRPAADVLEVIAVLRRHVPDDTYRFEAARDFSGRNVYRSTLLRLESFERVHEAALRAGHLDAAIAFAKGRALERLRAFDLAAGEYRAAAERDATLAAEAQRSAALCDALDAARGLALDLADLSDASSEPALAPGAPKAERADFDARASRLEALLEEAGETHHRAVVREEIERNDVTRARVAVARRHVVADGDLRAIAELQRVIQRHRESKLVRRHLLALADLYAALASEYVEAHAPEGLHFDPARFQELVDSAARLYEAVATQDGTIEKLEAGRRLEAFLAFALRVDRDRFSP